MLPVSQVRPTVEETWAGIKAMCAEIKSEFVTDSNGFDQINEIPSWDENNVIQSFP